MTTKAAPKKAPAKPPTKEEETTKAQAAQSEPAEDNSVLPQRPSDPSADQFQADQDGLQQPGAGKPSDREQFSNKPGYSEDQLAHMREYWDL